MKLLAIFTFGYTLGVIAPHAWSPWISGALCVLGVLRMIAISAALDREEREMSARLGRAIARVNRRRS